MTPTVALIHTSPTMVPVFKSLTDELLPGVSVFNMADESLLRDITREGRLIPRTAKRLVGHVAAAVDAGATHVLVTCSSMGPAVEAAAGLVDAVVLRVDEPMARKAVSIGKRIGVIATLPSTLGPTVDLIQRRATGLELKSRVVEGAFAAVMGGDGAKHDKLVGDALRELASQVDVIVLAQASMARVAAALPAGEIAIPVLSSPRAAVEHLATLLK
jgi:Asp/Glu/hydantoin racemase